MGADLYQVTIARDETPVTNILEAEHALTAVGVEFDAIEFDGFGGEIDGIYLVGLLPTGQLIETAAHCGDHYFITSEGFVVEVPQP